MTYVCSVMYCCAHPVLKLANLLLKYLQQKAQLDKVHPVPENHIGIGVNVSYCLYMEIKTRLLSVVAMTGA